MNIRTLTLATAVSLCSFAAALLCLAPAALAVTPPVVEEESVLDASATSATFQATIDPQGSETTYRFEYGPSEAYGSSVPAPDGLLGSGSSPITVTAHVQGLTASTSYHYRVVATVPSREETVDGADGTFSTQRLGGAFALPDGRQWELVTPPDKHGASIKQHGGEGLIQAAEDGSAITYEASSPTELEPAGYDIGVQVFSRRGARGWSSKDISLPNSAATTVGIGIEDRFFSSDLSLGLVDPKGPFTPLTAAETEQTPNIRHDFSCEVGPEACFTPLVTASNVPPGTKFGPIAQLFGGVDFVDATPDLGHIILSDSRVPLTSTPGDEGGLYEWSGGHLQLVNILPAAEGGKPTGPNVDLGFFLERIARSVSDDGSRVFWTVLAANTLYVRDTVRQETLRIGDGEDEFQAASSDGSRVFYTAVRGEPGTGTRTESLEVCDIVLVAGKLACNTTQLAPDVQGSVLGVSEDGSWVYFMSNSVLAPGAVPGTCENESAGEMCNLYAAHYNGAAWESPKLIAVLPTTDASDWHRDLSSMTARVSPDGRWLAFMSERSLTGYDNRDVASSQPDEEVYLYDAQTDKLVCASCDPTGARPIGSAGRAASIPGWTPSGAASAAALYQSRYLSNSGRLFFNSRDALVPQDVNGEWDVYELEPEGVGGCASQSVTFNASTGACVGLISSGTSPEESLFMDASGDGSDVFFMTSSRLVPEDFDTANDIYDAHVCSAGSPCLVSPVSPPPCSTGDACKAAPTPQPAIFGSPASSTFSGAGNVSGSSNAGAAPRSLTSSQKLARALRECRRKPRGRKRRSCDTTARRRFAAKQSRNARTSGGGHR